MPDPSPVACPTSNKPLTAGQSFTIVRSCEADSIGRQRSPVNGSQAARSFQLGVWLTRTSIKMKTLNILWQRLVTPEGETCERCGGTYDAIVQAIPKLREALRPLGIEPVLETREIALDAFKGMPSESNRIWIAGRSIEDWLGAGVGKSTCCSACGGAECRTLEVGRVSFEAIPEQLILEAALLAASASPSADKRGGGDAGSASDTTGS